MNLDDIIIENKKDVEKWLVEFNKQYSAPNYMNLKINKYGNLQNQFRLCCLYGYKNIARQLYMLSQEHGFTKIDPYSYDISEITFTHLCADYEKYKKANIRRTSDVVEWMNTLCNNYIIIPKEPKQMRSLFYRNSV